MAKPKAKKGGKLAKTSSGVSSHETGGGEYYFGVPGNAADAWKDISPHEDQIELPSHSKTQDKHYQSVAFPPALNLHTTPGPFCLPQEMLSYSPSSDVVTKYFFKGTAKEVAIRQIFFHRELSEKEEDWIRTIRDYCRWKNFPIRSCLEPYLLRICLYNWRKFGDAYPKKAYEHILETVNWRAKMFPMVDTDPDILDDLNRGVMYWTARDKELRPLLVVRLRRLPRSTPPEKFKRLTVFCFEWAMRHLFVPGLVETCTVVFDVRGIAIHHFPMSALSDMTNTLTKQYPFRLDRMFIINDSLFIQTVWSIAKQFLTEVQQQKMGFMRTGYDKELLKIYSPHQLEKEFGGTRAEIKEFYPFPLTAGPYTPGSSNGPNPSAVPNCYEVMTPEASVGKIWIGNDRPPLQWSEKAFGIFSKCNITPPMKPKALPVEPSIVTPLTSPPVESIVDDDMEKIDEMSHRESIASVSVPRQTDPSGASLEIGDWDSSSTNSSAFLATCVPLPTGGVSEPPPEPQQDEPAELKEAQRLKEEEREVERARETERAREAERVRVKEAERVRVKEAERVRVKEAERLKEEKEEKMREERMREEKRKEEQRKATEATKRPVEDIPQIDKAWPEPKPMEPPTRKPSSMWTKLFQWNCCPGKRVVESEVRVPPT